MTGDEINHPLDQAQEAIREAIRKLDSGMCPKCGRTDPHGDEEHWSVSHFIAAGTITASKISYPECSNGPDCQCPFHFGLQRVRVACPVCGLTTEHGDRLHQYRLGASGYELTPGPELRDQAELELRRRRREIADQLYLDNRELAAEVARLQENTGWHEGKCTGCFMDDEPVKGPPGAELCRFCDERRILAPAPPPPPPPARHSIWQDVALLVSDRSFAISCALLMTGCVLMFSGSAVLGAAVWLAGFFWPSRHR